MHEDPHHTFFWTQFPSLYDTVTFKSTETDWAGFVVRTSEHLVTQAKDAACGFGPYLIAHPCTRHQQKHRCDECVPEITLAVFDVDADPTPERVQKTRDALAARGVAQHWWTTWSYTETKPAWRLVIPLLRPIPAAQWKPFRAALIQEFHIPADPVACSGVSHFYYLPSKPPGAVSDTFTAVGGYLDPASYIANLPALYNAPRRRPPTLADWTPPPEPTTPVDLKPLRELLQKKATAHVRREETNKAELLRRLLRGEALAQHKARNTSTFVTAGMLAWTLPGQSLGTLKALMHDSVEAMIAQGSSITWPEVERFLLTAMRHKAEADANDEEITKRLWAQTERVMAEARAHAEKNPRPVYLR